jgi:hypothetical protein
MCRAITVLVLKPNSWIYHARIFSQVLASLAICQVLVVVLAIKAQYYLLIALFAFSVKKNTSTLMPNFDAF